MGKMGGEVRRKPEGGFRFVTVGQIAMAWWAYQRGYIRMADLRTYWAVHALAETRCQIRAGKSAQFDEIELERWLGRVGRRSIRAAIRRLERVGLLTWSAKRIAFATEVEDLDVSGDELADITATMTVLSRPGRRVPVPRRTLSLLAHTTGRAKVATLLGHVVRCMRYQGGKERGCIASGLCKSSWIAETFGVSLRGVKAARRELVDIGWLQTAETPVWAANRWGLRVCIKLDWNGAGEGACARSEIVSAPHATGSASSSAPLDQNKNPPVGRIQNQNPIPAQSGGRRPNLADIVADDLRNPRRLAQLCDQARQRGWLNDTEADVVNFATAAVHAMRVGQDTPRLFRWLVENRRWDLLTQADEDAVRGGRARRIRGRREDAPDPDHQRRREELRRQARALVNAAA